MKKFIISLVFLLATTIAFAQTLPLNKNFQIRRGDQNPTLQIAVNGDHTARKLSFVIKANTSLTGSRLVQKYNSVAGGSGITTTYSGGKTTLTIDLDPEDTQDFTAATYVYDVVSQANIIGTKDIVTIAYGNFNIQFDVQTPYDGSNLPAGATRYIPYYPLNFAQNDILQMVGTEFIGVQPSVLIGGVAYTKAQSDSLLGLKQNTLVSGTNIKTINGNTVLGSGDLAIVATMDSATFATKYWTNTQLANKVAKADSNILKSYASYYWVNSTFYTQAQTNNILNSYALLASPTFSGKATFNEIQMSPTPTLSGISQGKLYWDATDKTLAVDLSAATTLQIGQEQFVLAVNKTGVQINDGEVVYISGAQGNRPKISLARADAYNTSYVIGVATDNIANDAEGYITVNGIVRGYNTASYTTGDRLYLSATSAGQLTKTMPNSPNNIVVVATALNATNNGSIYVHPQQPLSADSLLSSVTNLVPPTQKAIKYYIDNIATTKVAKADSNINGGYAAYAWTVNQLAGKQPSLGYTPVNKADSANYPGYITRTNFTSQLATKIAYADTSTKIDTRYHTAQTYLTITDPRFIGKMYLRDTLFFHDYSVANTYRKNFFAGPMAGGALALRTSGNPQQASHIIAIGYKAGYFLETGYNDIFIGSYAGYAQKDSMASYNTIIGYNGLRTAVIAQDNAGVGAGVLEHYNGTGYNSAFGTYTLTWLTTGIKNTAAGWNAGTGDNGTETNWASKVDNYMVFIGDESTRDSSISKAVALSNGIAIGSHSKVARSNSMVLGGTGSWAVNVGIGVISPLARLHLPAGTATANTAPLKFTSGTLLTSPEAGVIEFNNDSYYATITSGSARKTFAFLESPSFTTPNIGAANGTSLSLTENFSIGATKYLYLDGGGNTYLTESSADVVDLYVGGSSKLNLTTTNLITYVNIYPSATNTLTIGIDANRWSNVYSVLGNYTGTVTVNKETGGDALSLTSTTSGEPSIRMAIPSAANAARITAFSDIVSVPATTQTGLQFKTYATVQGILEADGTWTFGQTVKVGNNSLYAKSLTLGANTGTSGQLNFIASDNDQANIAINTSDQLTFNSAGGGYVFDNNVTTTGSKVSVTPSGASAPEIALQRSGKNNISLFSSYIADNDFTIRNTTTGDYYLNLKVDKSATFYGTTYISGGNSLTASKEATPAGTDSSTTVAWNGLFFTATDGDAGNISYNTSDVMLFQNAVTYTFDNTLQIGTGAADKSITFRSSSAWNYTLLSSGDDFKITDSDNLEWFKLTYSGKVLSIGANISFLDKNIALSATTGTKIGTATSQKLAFYNSTPIVQPSGNVFTALTNLGLVASPSLTISNITNLQTTLDSKQVFHGIEASGTLSFDNSTHILTMEAGANTYWFQGTKYTTASAITCDLDSYVTLTTNTLYYVYFDDATGTLKASASNWNLKTHAPVATVFWNGTAGAVGSEVHNYTRDLDWHINAHNTIGARYGSGLSQTNPTTANDALLQIESGTIYDEDVIHTIAQQTTMRGWYQASASVYTFADYSLPYLGTSGQPQYLDTDTYTLTNAGVNEYVNMWVYASNDISRRIYIIPTQGATAHATIASARASQPPSLSGLGFVPEIKLIYKWIYRGNGDYEEGVDYRNASTLPAGGTASTTAGAVSFVPYGNISSTTVQTAIQELEDEKMTNPMTTAGDIIYGGTSGAPTRLAGSSGALTNNGSGTLSYTAIGTSANNLVKLDGSAKLPAVDGSQLTNLPSTGATILKAAKTADETVTNSTTLQDDDHLTVTVEANTNYIFEAYFYVYNENINGRPNIEFNVPSGTTGVISCFYQPASDAATIETAAAAVSNLVDGAFLNSVAGYGTATVTGTIYTSSTAGTAKIKWAQRAATATSTTLKKGCYIKLTKI